jgi:superfamily II DNA or RNA helicase
VGDEGDGGLEVVAARGRQVRRIRVTAERWPLDTALPDLVALPVEADGVSPSLAAWSLAAKVAVDLVARGRIIPSIDPSGTATWRVGPIDPADHRLLDELATAMPPEAHALPLTGSRPLRIRSARSLLDAFVDAVADRLVRTAAAPFSGRGPNPWSTADAASTPVDPVTAAWVAGATSGTAERAYPGLRLSFPDDPEDQGEFTATVQLRSHLDPSLIVDAADLWEAPGPVLARLGDHADVDLLVALRRAARVWPPIGRLLDEARPEVLTLDDDEAVALLGETAEQLGTAGLEVLWPTELVSGGVSLRTVVSTPSPTGVAETVLRLDQLLQPRWEAVLGGEALSADELDQLADAKRPLVRLRGRWVLADPEMAERLRRRARPLRASEALAAALSGRLTVDGDEIEVRIEGGLADVLGRLRDDHARELPEPPGLDATLRPYQRRGLAWLVEMTSLGLGGCLADDMGLGKTVQLIALHLHRHPDGPDAEADDNSRSTGPTLVVCPASLLGNWEREIGRFAPAVPVRRYHGGDRHLDDLAGDEVVLATYGVVRRDHAVLAEVGWGLVVADEAQHAKNPLSRTARALRAIPSPARVALTGTPIENRLTELWALLDWTTPGLLGPLDRFRRQVAVPVERHRDPDATAAFTRTVRPFLLRRRKIDPGIVPDLPPKTETDEIVPLTGEQVTLYEAVVRESLAEIAEADGMARRGLVLRLLTSLKQICNHPAQFLGQPGPLGRRSGKLDALDELLEVILDNDESVLIFSQYVAMARLLERHLADAGVPTLFLHGGVTAPRRDAMVERFQAGEVPVFLLSLKAGGTGLNLTRANHVVHFDRWWNPAVEDQASDRAWRIGQERPVHVHRLVTEGTVEDRIGALLASKRSLADAVVGAGEGWISELGDDELASLVALDGDAGRSGGGR